MTDAQRPRSGTAAQSVYGEEVPTAAPTAGGYRLTNPALVPVPRQRSFTPDRVASVQNLMSDMGELKGDVGELRGTVNGLEKSVDELKSDFKDHAKRTEEQIKAAVTTMTAAVSEIKTDLKETRTSQTNEYQKAFNIVAKAAEANIAGTEKVTEAKLQFTTRTQDQELDVKAKEAEQKAKAATVDLAIRTKVREERWELTKKVLYTILIPALAVVVTYLITKYTK